MTHKNKCIIVFINMSKTNFWKRQPITKTKQSHYTNNNMYDFTKNELYQKKEELNIAPFVWSTVDLNDEKDVQGYLQFINDNYYYQKDNINFKNIFTLAEIKIDLPNPNIIVIKYDNKIYGAIAYNVKETVWFSKTKLFAKVDYICIHHCYRNGVMYSALTSEVIRRLVNEGVYQGYFVSPTLMNAPSCMYRTYFRPLNYNKLVRNRYIILKDATNTDLHQKFKETTPPLDYYVKSKVTDAEVIYNLYNKFSKIFNMYVKYTYDELTNLLYNNPNVHVYNIVNKAGEIVDFVSYYDKKIINMNITNPDPIHVGYLFLYTCNVEYSYIMASNMIKILAADNYDLFVVSDMGLNSDFMLASCKYLHEYEEEENISTKVEIKKENKEENKEENKGETKEEIKKTQQNNDNVVHDLRFLLHKNNKKFLNFYNWDGESVKACQTFLPV